MLHVNMEAGAAHAPPAFARHGPPQPSGMVGPELFKSRVEAEVVRHARYLSGIGILRISPRRGRHGAEALREAVETETRRTDCACAYPDGSFAVLVVNAKDNALEVVARRLEQVAKEISGDEERSVPDYVVGACLADDKRVSADELWNTANDAMEVALETSVDIAFGRWT